jgi:hypothetical protein
MAFWDWIALLTGIAGVLLTIFQSIWCWPMALNISSYIGHSLLQSTFIWRFRLTDFLFH